MWIDFEPGLAMMVRVLLCFEYGDPDPEDSRVREYLTANNLEPKRVWVEERNGVECEVIQFGQCYLGGHLQAIHLLRRQGIMAEAVSRSLKGQDDLLEMVRGVPEAALLELSWELARVVLEKGAAVPAPDNPLDVYVEPQFLREELQRLLTAKTK